MSECLVGNVVGVVISLGVVVVVSTNKLLEKVVALVVLVVAEDISEFVVGIVVIVVSPNKLLDVVSLEVSFFKVVCSFVVIPSNDFTQLVHDAKQLIFIQ